MSPAALGCLVVASCEPLDEAVAEVTQALDALARRLDRAEIRFGASVIDPGAIGELRPEEAVAVEAAVASRRAEFASGRVLLRRLLDVDVAIPAAVDRCPVLPAGVTASVAHDAGLVIVAVARDDRFTIGVDLERSGVVDEALAPVVLRTDESGLDPTVAFCAKEAVYKSWSMAGGRFLEHQDVRIAIDGEMIRAEVISPRRDDPSLLFSGGWTSVCGRCVVLVVAERVDAR
jgi:4'-phosphopantetheinyl transferase EntD